MKQIITFAILALLISPCAAQTLTTYAIIENGNVVNTVDYPAQPTTPPPGFPQGDIAVPVGNSGASFGWTYANGVFTNPNPPAPQKHSVP